MPNTLRNNWKLYALCIMCKYMYYISDILNYKENLNHILFLTFKYELFFFSFKINNVCILKFLSLQFISGQWLKVTCENYCFQNICFWHCIFLCILNKASYELLLILRACCCCLFDPNLMWGFFPYTWVTMDWEGSVECKSLKSVTLWCKFSWLRH